VKMRSSESVWNDVEGHLLSKKHRRRHEVGFRGFRPVRNRGLCRNAERPGVELGWMFLRLLSVGGERG